MADYLVNMVDGCHARVFARLRRPKHEAFESTLPIGWTFGNLAFDFHGLLGLQFALELRSTFHRMR